MALVFGQTRRAVVLLVVLTVLVGPLLPSLAGPGHPSPDGGPATGTALLHHDGAVSDPSHCGFPSCGEFLPARDLAAANRLVPVATAVLQNDGSPERRLVGVDPPIPR
jgi:hypothetical protein